MYVYVYVSSFSYDRFVFESQLPSHRVLLGDSSQLLSCVFWMGVAH